MQTIKYIVVMIHKPAIGDGLTYYYKGQNKKGENCFGLQKSQAQRFLYKEEALRAMSILMAIDLCPYDSYSVVSINCRG